MIEDQLKQYYNMFTDAWKLFRKYKDISTDKEWVLLLNEARGLAEKYNNNPFCNKIVTETVCELYRLDKERKEVM